MVYRHISHSHVILDPLILTSPVDTSFVLASLKAIIVDLATADQDLIRILLELLDCPLPLLMVP